MIDIEMNVIANVLKTLVDPATLTLDKKHFSCQRGKKIWSAIDHHVSRKITPDLMTVVDYLETVDKNGALDSWTWLSDLGQMTRECLPPSSVPGHAKAIREKWKVRQVKTIGSEMSHDEEADINKYIKELMELNTTEKNYLHTFAEAADNALVEIEKVMAGESVTIPTGLEDIDKVMGGLHKSDLIIVAARSAMGKTAFLLNMAAANKSSPLIFSTEQSNIQAAARLFSIYGNVPNHLIRTGEIGNEEFGKISSAI
uniref:replicative DNA helicase n=1 Tax=Pseudoalteromonas sp. TaxID=53249 RepID=UPI003566FF5D